MTVYATARHRIISALAAISLIAASVDAGQTQSWSSPAFHEPTLSLRTKERPPILDKRILAADCARAVTNFVAELDKALAEENYFTDKGLRYEELFRQHLFPDRNWSGVPSLPDRPRLGCNVNDIVAIAKRSRFLYEIKELAAGDAENYVFVIFRNWHHSIQFRLNKEIGSMYSPSVWPRHVWTWS
jgi:hypothetical protein